MKKTDLDVKVNKIELYVPKIDNDLQFRLALRYLIVEYMDDLEWSYITDILEQERERMMEPDF